MDTRRDFLKKAAMLTGATGLSGLLPASIQKAMAINPAPGSTYLDAEHVVILMQENRSFDHMFGTLRGVRGFNDPRAITLPNKNLVWLQSFNNGDTYAPFRLDLKNTKSTWMSCLPHNWDNQVNARNDGKFDQWLEQKRSDNDAFKEMPLTLGYNTREDVPFYYALADAFTVCDQHFCSSLTGTDSNRLFFWSGTIREEQNENSRPNVYNDDADYGKFQWTTFPERLEDNYISWKCYQNEISIDVGFHGEEDPWLSNFGDNPLENFKQYNIFLYKKHISHLQKRSAEIPGEINDLQKKIDALPAGDGQLPHMKKQLHAMQSDMDDINKELAGIQPDQFDKLSGRDKNLHHKAFSSNQNDPNYHELTTLTYDDNGIKREVKVPKGDVLHEFRQDVDDGNLPTVSWITAPQNFSDHPSAPWYGAWYLSEVMDILTKNPEVWKKTIFILTYDENDGYFDHVPPFTAPHSHKSGTGKVSDGIDTRVDFVTLEQELERKGFPEEFDKESPIGLGYRVPMIIASPWSRGGWVNSEVFDHTSTLQFLERFLNSKTGKSLQETNISTWRRTICGDLTSAFRPNTDDPVIKPDFLSRNKVVENIHNAKFKKLPSDYKLLSADEIVQINHNASSPYMPKQEPGIKPSCGLPYELYADGQLSADKKTFSINFEAANAAFGKNALGSPFNVYAPGKYLQENVRTWAYALTAGDKLADEWPINDFENDSYHLRVYGPNGFFREYAGSATDPDLGITCDYQQSISGNKLTGNIELKLRNLSQSKSHTIEITDNAYKSNHHTFQLTIGNYKSMILNLNKSHNWYDFTVKVQGDNTFMKRYAGRVEMGAAGYSDPFMGGLVL